jgi:hypothetical protein
MVACDFNLNFTLISRGSEGSASDVGVLRSAISKGFHVPKGKFYLVDGGYANTPEFLAPYRSVRYHLSEFRRLQVNMLITRKYSIIAMQSLETILRGLLGF